MTNTTPLPGGYAGPLTTLKREIRHARIRAHRHVNTELLILSWKIGKEILDPPAARKLSLRLINKLAASNQTLC